MSSLWAAPFLGEFGHECAVWSPWLRYQQDRLGLPMTVVCERGKALLYEDFAKVVEIESVNVIRDCQHALTPRGGKLVKEDYENYVTEAARGNKRCITPLDLQVTWHRGPPEPKFHIYKSYRNSSWQRNTSVVVHARSHQHDDRNWHERRWKRVVHELKADGHHVISVGSKDAALHIEGTEDHRGVTLEILAQGLSAAQFIVGPSSGPLAFAMLCELPVVWWSGQAKNGPRFDKVWNPFDTKVTHVANNWNPTPEQVIAACRREVDAP